MNLDKWGLVFFINYFNQIDTVKKHLGHSVRELLLALSASLDIVQKTADRNRIFNRFDLATLPLKRIDALLQFAVSQLPPPALPVSPDALRLKQHVVESIIAVIDEEIETLAAKPSPRNQLKVEALGTVKQVLHSHLQEDDLPVFDALPEEEDQVANLS